MAIASTPSISKTAMGARTRGMVWVEFLLLGATLAAVLYVVADTIAALRYSGYNYADQTISELSAVGAETRSLWIPFGVVYSLLTLAFAFAVLNSPDRRRRVRVVGGASLLIGVIALAVWPFAPMHQREVLAAGGGTFSDTMHIARGMIDTLLLFTAMVAGAGAFGRRFRLYTIVTIVVVLIAGAVTGIESPRLADDASTPGLGIAERVAIFSSMFWLGAFGIALLRERSS
jgi:hypothetical protein